MRRRPRPTHSPHQPTGALNNDPPLAGCGVSVFAAFIVKHRGGGDSLSKLLCITTVRYDVPQMIRKGFLLRCKMSSCPVLNHSLPSGRVLHRLVFQHICQPFTTLRYPYGSARFPNNSLSHAFPTTPPFGLLMPNTQRVHSIVSLCFVMCYVLFSILTIKQHTEKPSKSLTVEISLAKMTQFLLTPFSLQFPYPQFPQFLQFLDPHKIRRILIFIFSFDQLFFRRAITVDLGPWL